MSDRIPTWLNKGSNGGIVCGRCGGSGEVVHDEDGRRVMDACYHCGNTGEIDPSLALSDLIDGIASRLADQEIGERRSSINKAAREGDGEDWEFLAAENMMTGHDLYRIRVDQKATEIAEELGKLPTWLQWLLVDDYHHIEAREAKDYTKMMTEPPPEPDDQSAMVRYELQKQRDIAMGEGVRVMDPDRRTDAIVEYERAQQAEPRPSDTPYCGTKPDDDDIPF